MSKPATDPSNLGNAINAHLKCKTYVDSIEAAENFISIMSGTKKDIAQSISSAHDAIVSKNILILKGIIDIEICGNQIRDEIVRKC